MPGRPPWSQPGTQGGGQTVATNDRPAVVVVTADQTADVAAGNQQRSEIYAPAGSVYYVNAMALDCQPPGSATSGQHKFKVRSADQFADLDGGSNYTDRVRWLTHAWRSATSYQYPSDEATQTEAEQTLMATENQPLAVVYGNNTDVTNSNNRNITFIMEESSY